MDGRKGGLAKLTNSCPTWNPPHLEAPASLALCLDSLLHVFHLTSSDEFRIGLGYAIHLISKYPKFDNETPMEFFECDVTHSSGIVHRILEFSTTTKYTLKYKLRSIATARRKLSLVVTALSYCFSTCYFELDDEILQPTNWKDTLLSRDGDHLGTGVKVYFIDDLNIGTLPKHLECIKDHDVGDLAVAARRVAR
ncbi:hypothetical protein OIDMADRAFT_50344 [Oidiodendron maius Zn]|uniref:Uncharacterized protein n=1 Tax=Oidiodendron maius (strain Zn) TaxID=913774 RepID=A0A0C3HQ96_OIDMZ|nr:hypothetical protein OIDMADRAFT_50344 [Oidiodendron maius Zn]